jgi:ferrous iron transport protein B
VAVVIIINVVSSVGADGSWGNQNTENSALSSLGKVITPVFTPMGIGEKNWPATVGLFTGLFAKEVVVGTLDTLYDPPKVTADERGTPDYLVALAEAFDSVVDNISGLVSAFSDPLKIASAQEDITADQPGSYQAMQNLFPSAWGAFCYLVFILLYAHCVATIGVMQKEAGQVWLGFSVAWSLLLSYWLASNLWHLSLLTTTPIAAGVWIAGSTLFLYFGYRFILAWMKQGMKDQIPVVNL